MGIFLNCVYRDIGPFFKMKQFKCFEVWMKADIFFVKCTAELLMMVLRCLHLVTGDTMEGFRFHFGFREPLMNLFNSVYGSIFLEYWNMMREEWACYCVHLVCESVLHFWAAYIIMDFPCFNNWLSANVGNGWTMMTHQPLILQLLSSVSRFCAP